MIRHLQKLTALVLFCCFFCGSSTAWAQVQYEPFTGTGALVNSGWVHHSPTGSATGEIQIVNGSLPATNMPAPTGNKIAITATGAEDANLALSSAVNSGSVYASFLVKPESGLSTNSTGAYFLHFAATAGDKAATFASRVTIRSGSAANTFNLGVLNNSGGTATAATIFGENPTDYAVGQTYFVVVKYDIAGNTSSIWVNPSPGVAEPAAATVSNNSGDAASQIAAIAVRQSSGTGNIQIDEIRVGTTWAAVTPAGTPTTAPTLTPSTGSVNLGDILIGNAATGSYTLTAANIPATQEVVLTASAPFTISTSETGTFSNTLTLIGADLATSKTIYVKAAPTVAGSISGEIVHTSAGLTNVVVGLLVNGSGAYVQNFNVCSDELPGGWSQFSVTGAQTWECTTYGTDDPATGNMTNAVQISGYADGSNQVNEDWFISPKLDLSGFTIPVASIDYRTKFPGSDLLVKVSTNYTGAGSPAAATWTTLATLKSDEVDEWLKLELLLDDYTAANTHIAFVYNSTTAGAARWTLDNFNVENVDKYLAIADVSHDFGIVEAHTPTAPLTYHTFNAVGFTEPLVISSYIIDPKTVSHIDFEFSKTNTNDYSESVTYTVDELNDDEPEKLYIRFLPKSTYIKFQGEIKATSGEDFEQVLGIVTGSSVLKESTLDVVTWNLEWFGADSNGPTNDELQKENAKAALLALDADIVGVQEIANQELIETLAEEAGYEYVTETLTGQQQVGFLYRPEVISVKKEKVLLSKLYADIESGDVNLSDYPGGNDNLLWSSGRLPYMVQFEATIDGKKQIFNVVNIHAKANEGEDMQPYNRRAYDVKVLKDSLEAQYANTNIIILGDFNDDVDVSVVGSNPSTYAPFVTDEDFIALTLELSETGAYTYESGSFKSFLDHIIISDRLEEEYIEESIAIEDQLLNLIPNFRSTTSDHVPVSARFNLSSAASVSFSEATVTKAEDAGTFTVSLALSGATATEQTVTISATGGTATTADYTLTGATEGKLNLTIPANATTATFNISIADDSEEEGEEQVALSISGTSSGIEIGSGNTFTLVIEDNEGPNGIADGTKGQFTVYPNPVSDAGVILQLPERIAAQTKVSLTVYALDGKQALKLDGTLTDVQQQLAKQSGKLKSGMYIMLVETDKEFFQTKLIKQ